MNSPLSALAWEIWTRGKHLAGLALACLGFCAFLNLGVMGRFAMPGGACEVLHTVFALLMVLSFLLLMGIFNYTEFNSTKDWNGFPYRLFTLPVRTWQLVALPMILSVLVTEAVYFAWIKLVWSREPPPMPGWFAVVLGVYVILYQTILWGLAGFRILRIMTLALGGASCLIVASMPFFARLFHWSWLTDRLLIAAMILIAATAYVVVWTVVSRQRHGGGRRQNWVVILANRVADVLPERTRDFASPAAAQFWLEWRRTGWLLPGCTLLAVVVIFLPMAWFNRHDPAFTTSILVRLLCVPLVLALVIGKGFVRCEFWSTSFGVPNFLAVRPFSAVEHVRVKMKVAAVGVIVAWLAVFGFLGVWLSCGADTADLQSFWLVFRALYPRTWLAVMVLSAFALLILTWRLMVAGLWIGLSGNRTHYSGGTALQVFIPVLLAIAGAISADAIDRAIQNDPIRMQSLVISGATWILAALVAMKFWSAAILWRKVDRTYRRQYLRLWGAGLACLVTLAILVYPTFETHHCGHLLVLGALWLFPLARMAIAPASFAKNWHR